MRHEPAGRTLWLSPVPRAAGPGDVVIVLDAAWTPPPDARHGATVSMRDAVDAVLAVNDPILAASDLLDEWAAASGVIGLLAVEGTSLWYLVRLREWLWLEERIIWAKVLRWLLDEHHPTAIACAAGVDAPLLDVTRLMAAADGMPLRVEGQRAVVRPAPGAPGSAAGAGSAIPRTLRRIARRLQWLASRRLPVAGPDAAAAETGPSMAFMHERLARLAQESEPRLLVVMNHVPQRIDTPNGSRFMNAYLGPVADRLRGTRLEPILVDMLARRTDPASIERVSGPGTDRVLSTDALLAGDRPAPVGQAGEIARVVRELAAIRQPVVTSRIDLGPALAAEVAATARSLLPNKLAAITRMKWLLARLPVAGILLADEYHRQDWMIAAAAAGVPVAAIQHGLIHARHAGYAHRDRPPQLRLVDRTYVFGRWERDVLVERSVYRDDEVRVGGSPRLDVGVRRPSDREAVRAELSIAAGDRLLVLSGTHGHLHRRFLYPVALARLFDREIAGVHLVVKLHPAETDEGPYRAVVEGVAAAGGFAPPPITVVRDVDLYRLLAAADAHLGIHSTVITEAVFVGTPNLLATASLGGDLLDWVAAGVALPVRDGADLVHALEAAAAGAITAAAREAFIAAHYEPGSASDRIAEDLLAWLH